MVRAKGDQVDSGSAEAGRPPRANLVRQSPPLGTKFTNGEAKDYMTLWVRERSRIHSKRKKVYPGQMPAFSETHRGLKSIMLVSKKITTVGA